MTSTAPHAGSLRDMFEPDSVAVVGASATPGKAGHQLVRALDGFAGEVFPINPRAQEVAGRRAYPAVAELASPPSLALVAVPPPTLPAALRDCAESGVRAAVICTGGLAESGEGGVALQEELGRIADATGIRVLGPNTSGFLNPAVGLFASFVPDARAIPAGGLAIVAQSGGVNHALAFLAASEGVGVRLAVGLGNAMRTGFVEVLEHMASDPEVAAVALHIEGVGDGRALFEAVEQTTERVPVVAMKVGRSDIGEFARSHTGVLAGAWRLTRAALAQAGAVVVDDTTELIDAARALGAARLGPSSDPGVGIVSGQAGPALVLTDRLGSAGVRVPELGEETCSRLRELLPPITYQCNPVDTGRPGELFPEVLRAVARDPAIDALAVYQLHEPAAADPAEYLAALDPGRTPVVLGTAGPTPAIDALRDLASAHDVPLYTTPERAASAVRALVQDSRARERRTRGAGAARSATSSPAVATPDSSAGAARSLNEDEAKRLLEERGIRTPTRIACSTREEACAAFERLIGPVVVKLLARDVQHKSEAGGVHVGIRGREQLELALDAIDRAAPPTAEGYLVEELAGPGPELIAGARIDSAFGPVVLLGAGGLLAEAIEDVSLRLAPVSHAEVEEMLGELRSARAFHGFRGAPAVKLRELADVLVVLADLVAGTSAITEIDVNPLRVTSEGLIALDAVAFVAGPARAAAGPD